MLACPHKILYGFRIHSRICYVGAECAPQGMGCCYCRQGFLMTVVVLLYQPAKHSIIVDTSLWCSVPFKKEEAYITVNSKITFFLLCIALCRTSST